MFSVGNNPTIGIPQYASTTTGASLTGGQPQGFNESFPAWGAVTSIDHLLRLGNENERLRQTNMQLEKQAEQLNLKVSFNRADPVKVEVSPDLSIRLARAENERDRLQLLLKERTEQLEELKLQVNVKPVRTESSVEALIQAAREEIEAQLAQEFKLKEQKVQEQLEILTIELNEQRLLAQSKQKELELMDSSMRNLERKCLDDMEILRQSITQGLWAEYDKKLDAKNEEYEIKLRSLEEENERISKQVQEWRHKCIESEERITSMLLKQDQVNEGKELRKLITSYENQVNALERELERVNLLQVEAVAHSTVSNQKVKYLEESLSDLEDKRLSFEGSIMERDAKIKALSKEIDRLNNESLNWRNHYDKSEKDSARLKTELNHLKVQITSSPSSNIQSRELLLERSEREKLQAELNATQAQLITVIKSKQFAEQQIQNLVEESAAKSTAIQALKEHFALKSQPGAQTDSVDLPRMLAGVSKILGQVSTSTSAVQNLEFGYGTLADGLRDSTSSPLAARQIFSSRLELASVELAEANQSLKQQLEAKQQEVVVLKKKLAETASSTEEVIKNGQSLAQEFIAMKSQLQEWQADAADKQGQLKEKDDIIVGLEKKLSVKISEADPQLLVKQSQQITEEWEQKLIALQREFDSQLRSKQEELASEKLRFESELDEKSSQFDGIKKQFLEATNEMKSVIQALETQLTEAKQHQSSTVQDLVQQLSKLQDEKQTLEKKLDQCSAEKTAIEESYRQLEDQSQRAVFETQRDSSTQLNMLQDALDKAKGSVESETRNRDTVIEGLKAELDAALKKAETAANSLLLSNNVTKSLEKGLEEAQAESSRKEALIKELKEQIGHKETTSDQTQVQDLVQNLEVLSAKSAKLDQEVGELKALNAQLLAEINELHEQKHLLENDVLVLSKELSKPRAQYQDAAENPANQPLVEEYEEKLGQLVKEFEHANQDREVLRGDNLVLAETVHRLQLQLEQYASHGQGDNGNFDPEQQLAMDQALMEENQRLAMQLEDYVRANQELAQHNNELQQQLYEAVVSVAEKAPEGGVSSVQEDQTKALQRITKLYEQKLGEVQMLQGQMNNLQHQVEMRLEEQKVHYERLMAQKQSGASGVRSQVDFKRE